MSVILIIDDQADVRMSASVALGNHGFDCREAATLSEGLELLKSESIDLVLLDMNFSLDTTSGTEGIEFLKVLRKENIQLPVVMMTGWASVDIAVQTMQLGAADFIEKPWKNTRLVSVVKQQLQQANLNLENARYSALTQSQQHSNFIETPTLADLLAKARRAAASDANILITGENGTGKSLLANYIHQHSNRFDKRFVSVNMGAIPESLFESELFGHKKGAFTDAKENRLGRFDIASNGTLFLDEIGTLPVHLQTKMLRVLETGEFEVVGSSKTQKTNARVISATNANIEKLISDQGFREDLFFRLNTIELHIPPLRERRQDILILAEPLLLSFANKYKRNLMHFADGAKDALMKHDWQGNIRELSHCIERAVILSDMDILTSESLGLRSRNLSVKGTQLVTLEESEKRAIKNALNHFDGNVSEAGDFLGLSKSALYRRLDKFNIEPKSC